MMDNGHKRKLYNNTKRQVYVNLFLKGIKTLKKSIGKNNLDYYDDWLIHLDAFNRRKS